MASLLPSAVLEQPRLALLYEISREISSRLDIDDLLPRLLQLTLTAVQGYAGSLMVFDDQGRLRHSVLLIDGHFHPAAAAVLSDILLHGLSGWVVRAGETVYVPDT